MVDHLNYDRTMRKKLDVLHTPSKSWFWWNMKGLPIELSNTLLVHTSGKGS